MALGTQDTEALGTQGAETTVMAIEKNRNFATQISTQLARTFSSPQPVPAAELLVSALSEAGAGENYDMNVDGSLAEVQFRYTVPAGKVALIQCVRFVISDNGIQPDEFGGLGGPLTNGCLFHVHNPDDSHALEIVDALPIKTNMELARLGELQERIGGTATDTLQVCWLPEESSGYVPILTEGMYLAFHVRDDLTGLFFFQAIVGGRIIDV